MKKYIHLSIVTILLLGLSAGRAHADDEALAAFGGFVAGMITGAVIDNHNDHDGVRVSVHRSYRDRKVDRRGPSGRWEIRRVRVWVPGHWEHTRNRCGERIRVWQGGRYESRKERVWVAYHDRGDRRRDRGYDNCRYRD